MNDAQPWPSQDGEMARRIRELDWAATPLGPITHWPQSLRTVIDLMLASPGMMSLVWGAGAVHIYNDAFTELLREHQVQALGRSALETFARSREVFEADLAAGMAGKSARLLAQRYPVLRNGRVEDAWFNAEYAPVRDESGAVAGVLWTLKEVTAQVVAEGALRESEARHRLLIESWAQAVWEADADGTVSADSPSWRAYTGQTFEQLIGYGWLDAIHPDDRTYAERQWRDAVAARTSVDAEFRLRAASGGWRWTNVRAAPLLDAAGNVGKWVGMNIDIEARKHVEAALRESEERLRGVLDGMTEGFGLLAPDFTILEHNAEALRMNGRSRHEVIGRSHWEVYPGTEDSELGRVLKQAMTERAAVSLEHEYAWAGGFVRWLDMRAYPTADGTLAVFWRDVTDRKQAEAALKQSERKYRTLFESMDEAYAVVEVLKDQAGRWTDFRYLDANPAFMVHTNMPYPVGRTATELLGTPNPRWTELYGQVLDTGEPLRVEESEGSLGIIFDLNIFALDRERNRVAVLFTNITDRKHAEGALRDNEERLRTLMEGVPQLVWRSSHDGHWTWASPQWTAFTGQTSDESRGRGWLEPVHPDDRDRAIAGWTAAATIGVFEADYRILGAAAGQYRWFQTRASPVRNAAGEIVEWLGTSTDIDDLRTLQQRQQLLLAELQHRVRNTLGIIKSLARRTAESSATVEDMAAHLDGRIEAFARVQSVVTRDPEAGVDLRDLVASELLAHAVREGERLRLTGPHLMLSPRAAETISLAVHELATNAVKHGALAGRGGGVNVAWQMKGEFLEFEWKEWGLVDDLTAPEREGFGMELLIESLPYELDAETRVAFEPGGLRFTLTAPSKNTLVQ